MSEASVPSVPKRQGNGAPSKQGAPFEAGLSSDDLENLLAALQAMQSGDFTVRLSGSRTGLAGKIADTFNDIVSTNQRMSQQLEYVGDVVGKQGKTRHRVKLGLNKGAWGDMEVSVNTLIDDLLWPTVEVTRCRRWPRATCCRLSIWMSKAGP